MGHCNQHAMDMDARAIATDQPQSWGAAAREIWQTTTGFVREQYAMRKRRRQLLRMHRLDDAMLRDIGVTRDELHYASGLPLSVNAALELQKLSLTRRRRELTGEAPR